MSTLAAVQVSMWNLQKKPEFKQKFPELTDDAPEVLLLVQTTSPCRRTASPLSSPALMFAPCADAYSCVFLELWEATVAHATNTLPDLECLSLSL